MRLRGLRVLLIVVFALLAHSNQAMAESHCPMNVGVDSVLVEAQAGCGWDVAEGVTMGAMSVFRHRLESTFHPSVGIDLTVTGTVDKKWVTGAAIGGGGHWTSKNAAGYVDALAFFTGTMATAPYVESQILFYPQFFGALNTDIIPFRFRLGLKVRMGRSSGEVLAGGQLYFDDLTRHSQTPAPGAFAVFQKTF